MSAVKQETMMKHVPMLAFSLCMAWVVPAQAENPVQSSDQVQIQERDRVYGSELMSPQERNEYHARMRSLNTEQAREAFRLEHHRQMQERAKAQGKTLYDMPPAGQGGGMGPGMGQGGGMGPGPRR
jgi:hypothetical protein